MAINLLSTDEIDGYLPTGMLPNTGVPIVYNEAAFRRNSPEIFRNLLRLCLKSKGKEELTDEESYAYSELLIFTSLPYEKAYFMMPEDVRRQLDEFSEVYVKIIDDGFIPRLTEKHAKAILEEFKKIKIPKENVFCFGVRDKSRELDFLKQRLWPPAVVIFGKDIGNASYDELDRLSNPDNFWDKQQVTQGPALYNVIPSEVLQAIDLAKINFWSNPFPSKKDDSTVAFRLCDEIFPNDQVSYIWIDPDSGIPNMLFHDDRKGIVCVPISPEYIFDTNKYFEVWTADEAQKGVVKIAQIRPDPEIKLGWEMGNHVEREWERRLAYFNLPPQIAKLMKEFYPGQCKDMTEAWAKVAVKKHERESVSGFLQPGRCLPSSSAAGKFGGASTSAQKSELYKPFAR
jgi:hypothetical protein